MFSTAVQPGLVSLFSSAGSDPLALFSTRTDASLPSDSFVCLLNDAQSRPLPPSPAALITSPRDIEDDNVTEPDYTLEQTVLHIQSPTLKTTYIICPPIEWTGDARGPNGDLGMQHPWIHLQVRNMGREWAFEIGIADQSGREGVVRCSTFQRDPRLRLGSPPLLHLPLAFPSPSSRPLTSWCTLALYLPSILPHFSSASLAGDTIDEESVRPNSDTVPSGTYSHVSYVKVYATCRLRRIWFSEGGTSQKLPWEFQLYGAQ